MISLRKILLALPILCPLVAFSLITPDKTLEINNQQGKPVKFSIWSFENGVPKKTFSGRLEKDINAFSFDTLNLPQNIIGTIGINIGQNYSRAYYDSKRPISVITHKRDQVIFPSKDHINHNIQKEIEKVNNLQKAILELDKSKHPDPIKREKLLALYERIRTHEKEKLDLSPLARKFLEVSYFTTDYSTSVSDPKQFSKHQLKHFFDFYSPSDIDLKHTLIHSTKISEYLSLCHEAFSTKESHSEFKKAIDRYLDRAMFSSEMYDFAVEEFTNKIPRIAHDDQILEYLDRNYAPTSCESDSQYSLAKKERLALYERMGIGKVAPNFSWPNKKSLHNVKAEHTVVLFWSSTCIHCRKNVPKIYNKIGKNNSKISVVAVSLDREKKNWRFFYNSKGLKGWHHILNKESKKDISRLYGVRGTPYYVVLDKNKKIVLKTHSTVRLYAELGIN